jgi:hypothetical protein
VPIPAHPADSPQARARRPARAPFFPVAALCASTSCARRVAVRKREGARPLWHRSAPRPPSAGSTYDRVILSPWRVDRRTAVRRPTHLSNRRPLFQRWRSTFERKRQDHREPNPGGDPITPPRALLVSSAGRSGSFSPPPLAKLPLRAIRGRRARRRCRGRRASVPRRPVAKPRSTQRTWDQGDLLGAHRRDSRSATTVAWPWVAASWRSVSAAIVIPGPLALVSQQRLGRPHRSSSPALDYEASQPPRRRHRCTNLGPCRLGRVFWVVQTVRDV